MTKVQAIPNDRPRLSPYLIVDGAEAAIDFYKAVFGAVERSRMSGPENRIGHAELEFGDSILMLADEHPEMGLRGPKSAGGAAIGLHLYVENVDAVFADALARGAIELRPLEDRFYGDRSGQFEDPFGHRWNISSHVEDVSAEEIMRRAQESQG